MNDIESINIESIYKECGAILKGHFVLSSGKHSDTYLQSAKVLQYPHKLSLLANKLAQLIKQHNIKATYVCAPAIGGLFAGYELARELNIKSIFTERVNGKMTLKRGFEVDFKDKVIICEDIITTGGSAQECANVIKKKGAQIVAFCSLANRGKCEAIGFENNECKSDEHKNNKCKLNENIPFLTLANFDFNTFEAQICPLCKDGSKPIKPGSNTNIKVS